jgi:hypothetical protein
MIAARQDRVSGKTPMFPGFEREIARHEFVRSGKKRFDCFRCGQTLARAPKILCADCFDTVLEAMCTISPKS